MLQNESASPSRFCMKKETHVSTIPAATSAPQAIRPRGPLDAPEEIHGAALETLFLQQVRALNDYHGLGYRLHY